MTWRSAKTPPKRTRRGQTHSEPMLVRVVIDEWMSFPVVFYAVSEYRFRDKSWQEEHDCGPDAKVTHYKPFAKRKGDR